MLFSDSKPVSAVHHLQEGLCQRVPAAAAHDQPRRVIPVAQVQVYGLRQGIQV